ncbi:hypothetical protein CLIB1444_01S05094 [[Candida] jaroonii]|uniref:Uncharacterized protein n=1 Tax=[Candida] jaroonii TaxID=467808 RepID=A0ACA9Y0C5_9ASCO|nr:hypothetical protein CLIB1444_01S05094 [[Candida] jaroonii]
MGFITPGKLYDCTRRSVRVPSKKAPKNRKRRRIIIENTFTEEVEFDTNQDEIPRSEVKKITKLEEFPNEILLNIFSYINLKDNHLHLTNSKLNKLFSFENLGAYYIEKILSHQFVHHLNTRINRHYPKLDSLLKEYKERGLNSFEVQETDRILTLFKKYDQALDVEVFRYQVAFQLTLDYFSNFFIIGLDDIEQERQRRSTYIDSKIKVLEAGLKADVVDYDSMSRLALISETQSLQEVNGNGPQIQTPGTEEAVETTEVGVYKFGIPVPKFPHSFNIITPSKYTAIKILMTNLNFKFTHVNVVLENILDSKLPIKKKHKLIKTIIKNQVFTIEESTLIKAFEMLIDCKYAQDFEKIVHTLLELFYKNDSSDGELWNYVKDTKEVELFHLLCGYANPNFIL